MRVENIQRCAARFVLSNYHNRDSDTTVINHLEWLSLEQRRQRVSLLMMYKIQLIPAKIKIYKNSFFQEL